MRLVSLWGDGFFAVVFVLLVAFLIAKKDKLLGYVLPSATFLGYLAKEFAQGAFRHDRPIVQGCEVLTNYADGYSFPSGHVTHYVILFGLVLFIATRHKRETWSLPVAVFAILNLILISYSRIYLGAHWLNDVMGGYILGGTFLYLSIKLYWLFSRMGIGRERVYDKKGYILKAGLIVKSKNKKDILLVHRQKQNDYSFPKGSCLKGESMKAAAKRELQEETGVLAEAGRKLGVIYYDYPEGDGKVAVHMFAGKFVADTAKKEKYEFPVWVAIEEVEGKLTYPNLRDYWNKVRGKL